ncbi:MAG TPA: methyl-accepting chemotaxis protein, partial [Negativicutes bacterium]
ILFSTDTERFISMYTPRSFHGYKAKMGDELAPGSGGKLCVETGALVDKFIPKEVYGMPFRTIALPVVKEGKTIGCVAIARDRDKQVSVREIADTLAATSEEVAASVQEMADYAFSTDEAMKLLADSIRDLQQGIQVISEMNGVICNIASQTNLLALNAAIEAARAGEAGRGFSVVAQEVKKLAIRSTQAIAKVNKVLEEINNSIKNVDENGQKTSSMAAEQARAINEISGAMATIADKATHLNDISKNL